MENNQGDLLADLYQQPSQCTSRASNIELNVSSACNIVSSDNLHQVEQQLDIFVSQLSQTETDNTATHSGVTTVEHACDSAKRRLSTHRQFGPGTEEYQLCLFDDLEKPQPTSFHGIDGQAIIKDILDEFMPIIRADIERRLEAAIAQKLNALSAKKSP